MEGERLMNARTKTPSTTIDAHGNAATGDAIAIALYDEALDRLLRFHPDVIALSSQLVTDHPECAIGHAMAAYLCLMSTEAGDAESARSSASSLRAGAATPRERAHLAAIDAWATGDWHGAARALDQLLMQWPTDLLALMFGHQLDFFLGDASNLRDRVGRSLLAFDPSHPHTGFVRGMHAFGLEEAGNYQAAENAGLAALDAHPDDVWAIHAVVHAYEMQGRVDDGIRLLTQRERNWGSGNLFTVHNWWHLGLYQLEAGRPDAALAIYDREIHHAQSAGIALEMLDASAMLWRLMLDGVDTGNRFAALAESWTNWSVAAPWYVFNDLHATMAFVGAGRVEDARQLVARSTQVVQRPPAAADSNRWMTESVGLPASRAVIAFSEQRYDDVLNELTPIRSTFNRFGGSHAQRDALQRTIVEAALRSGNLSLARALLRERLSVRGSSVYSWSRYAQVLHQSGDESGAAEANRQANSWRERFAAA
jgi:tetratricopeptide (TPR) repeat protein